VAFNEAVEFEYAADEVGENVAESATVPRSTGVQSHEAVDVADTDSQPGIETLFNMKLTVPARDVVAVMRFVVLY
jgi:hypothetical protein